MKNKKLFAILTLVCFMMTLMPVAAFAADAELDDTYIKNDGSFGTTQLDITDSAQNVYVFAVKDGVISRSLVVEQGGMPVAPKVNGIVPVTLTDGDSDGKYETTTSTALELSFKNGGIYTVYVAESTGTGLDNIVDGTVYKTTAELTEIMLEAAEATASMDKNTVTVRVDASAVYTLGFSGDASDNDITLNANNGFTGGVFTATLQEKGNAVRGAKLTYETLGYVTVTPIDNVTDKNGQAKFKVSASKAGDYKVFVSYNGYTETIDVTVDTNAAAAVTTVKQPVAPVALDTAIDTLGSFDRVAFKIADANGDVYANADYVGNPTPTGKDQYSLSVIKKPAGSAMLASSLKLNYVTTKGIYVLAGNGGLVPFDVEGEYVFKITLENGASATATVVVKEMGTPVAVKFVDAPTTIAYNVATPGVNVVPYGVVLVDANGVTATPSGTYTLNYSANGKAVKALSSTNLETMGKEAYIGSTIDVIAVYTQNGKTLTAVNTLTVVDVAQSIVYKKTDVEAAVNNRLYADIVDANGNVVTGLTGTAAQAVVLDKPENAVAVANVFGSDLLNDQVALDFIASVPGEYKVQTIVTYNTGVNYISDIVTINVGSAQSTFKDVIVLSIGSNNMIKNGSVDELLAAPEIKDGRTMIPMRAGLEAFGAKVDWNEANQSITAEMDGTTVVMTLGSKTYTVNGKVMTADAAPYLNEAAATTMVPAVFFTNAFGIVATPLYDANGVCDVLFSK